MLGVISSDFGWLLIAGICAWAVIMCLKVISRAIDHSATVHSLKLEVQSLREAKRARLRGIQTAEIITVGPELVPKRPKRKVAAASEVNDEAAGSATAGSGTGEAAAEDAAAGRAA
ncbi:MAG: hypothetical protein JSV91_13705 [Phycisphaerales bacterium]|nr:MAG: hypothetical protein JSV91_13705 [Phycisphaerales bacterium]